MTKRNSRRTHKGSIRRALKDSLRKISGVISRPNMTKEDAAREAALVREQVPDAIEALGSIQRLVSAGEVPPNGRLRMEGMFMIEWRSQERSVTDVVQSVLDPCPPERRGRFFIESVDPATGVGQEWGGKKA